MDPRLYIYRARCPPYLVISITLQRHTNTDRRYPPDLDSKTIALQRHINVDSNNVPTRTHRLSAVRTLLARRAHRVRARAGARYLSDGDADGEGLVLHQLRAADPGAAPDQDDQGDARAVGGAGGGGRVEGGEEAEKQLGDLRREYLKYHGYLAQLLESQDEPRKILSGDALRYLKEFHGDMERCAEYRRPLHNRRPRVGGMDGAHFYNKYRFLDNRQPVYVDAEAENKRKTLLEEARRYYMTIHCPTVPEAPTWDELMNSMSGTSDGTAEDFVQ